MSEDEITPVDQECIEIMYTVEQWLDHWSRMIGEPAGFRHVPAFVNSMHDLCMRLLVILEPDGEHKMEDDENEYVPTRDGAAH